MIYRSTKCDPGILFRITKKEADFVRKLPSRLKNEFEEYQKLKYKFHQLILFSRANSKEIINS